MKKIVSAKHINWLDFGIFDGACLFVCGFDYQDCIRHLKKKKTPDVWVKGFESIKEVFDEPNWGFCSKRTIDGNICYFLVIKKTFDFSDDSHAGLAHEVLHLISYNLRDLLDPMEENEAFCYTHTYIMNNCYKILRS